MMNRTALLLGCALAGALPLEAQGGAPRESAVTIGITRHIQSKVLGEGPTVPHLRATGRA